MEKLRQKYKEIYVFLPHDAMTDMFFTVPIVTCILNWKEINQSINHSINQSINQLINQPNILCNGHVKSCVETYTYKLKRKKENEYEQIIDTVHTLQ